MPPSDRVYSKSMARRCILLLLVLLAAAANGLAVLPESDFPATFAWKHEDMPGPAWFPPGPPSTPRGTRGGTC